MGHIRRYLIAASVVVMGLFLTQHSRLYAATPVNLRHQPASLLHSFTTRGMVELKEISRSLDEKDTLHVRIQETYAGYPVMGADAVLHLPKGNDIAKGLSSALNFANTHQASMNGTIYKNLSSDLAKKPTTVFSQTKADKAFGLATHWYDQKMGTKAVVSDPTSERIIFVDAHNKAHFAYRVNFFRTSKQADVHDAVPTWIIDAETFQIYQQWDDLNTESNATEDVPGGGIGGNPKMGKIIYDGEYGLYTKFSVQRNKRLKMCNLEHDEIIVEDYKSKEIFSYPCVTVDETHNNVYWNTINDEVNGGYGPSDDAMYAAIVVEALYQIWYGVPVLKNSDGSPMKMKMMVHLNNDNAYYRNGVMSFGDGNNTYYPLVSVGIGAHELSHGFTQQHSALAYFNQSGGMNEAFSDMAAQAAEFFIYDGKNSWQIAAEVMKEENQALRYMDQPSKDCEGGTPGDNCSIDNASQYVEGMNVHNSSGVFNRAFYLLATSPGWDTKKAFDVMVAANQHYWTSSATFIEGACGVIQAAKQADYDQDAVKTVFTTVGVDISGC